MAAKYYCFSLSFVSLALLSCVTALPSVLSADKDVLHQMMLAVDATKAFMVMHACIVASCYFDILYIQVYILHITCMH